MAQQLFHIQRLCDSGEGAGMAEIDSVDARVMARASMNGRGCILPSAVRRRDEVDDETPSGPWAVRGTTVEARRSESRFVDARAQESLVDVLESCSQKR